MFYWDKNPKIIISSILDQKKGKSQDFKTYILIICDAKKIELQVVIRLLSLNKTK